MKEREVPARLLPLSRKQRQALVVLSLLAGDFVALNAAFWLAYWLRFKIFLYYSSYSLPQYMLLVGVITPVWLVIFAAYQLYHSNTLFGGLKEYSQVFNAVTIGTLILVLFNFLARESAMVSRGWLVLAWVLAIVMIIVWRFLFRRTVYWLRRRRHLLSPTLIVGANEEGIALAEQLRQWDTSGLYIMGFVDDTKPLGSEVTNGYRVLGGLEDVDKLVSRSEIQDVIIAHTALDREQLLATFRSLSANEDVNLRLSSGLFEIMTTGLSVKELSSVPLIEVNKTRISGVDALMKGMLDYVLTTLGLILISPILLVIALLVRLDSPGCVIYRRRVMGVNGREFDAYKFRTMREDGDHLLEGRPDLQEKLSSDFKLKDDPRITRLGHTLRKFSLDELPQLFNVLLGQMSLVGPRMISPPEMEKYGKWGMNLLTVKPGITGLWQVSGRSDVSYEERVQMDMEYIRNWTIWVDIYLIVMTIPAVFKKKGAY